MRWLGVAFVVALAAMGWAHYRVEAIAHEIVRLKELLMDTLVARWRDADNIEHEVITPPRDGETAEAHVARHAEKVKLLKAQFPPAP